jgi:uncharacterized protein
VRRAGSGKKSGTSSRQHRGARRLVLSVPIMLLVATVTFVANGALRPPEPPRQAGNALISLIQMSGVPHRPARNESHRPSPLTETALQQTEGLEPVARATAPGMSGDGTVHNAASLLELRTGDMRLVPVTPTESPGNAEPDPSRGASRESSPAASAQQLAALTPAPTPAPSPPKSEQLAALSPLPPSASPAAWRVYAQPFDRRDKRPRLALIVAGTDDTMDVALASSLPAGVTLALDPYARHLADAIVLARSRGHEVMLTLSAPPLAHGRHDFGPMAILSSLDPRENLERLDWALGRTTGFVGVLDIVGNRPPAEAQPILGMLGQHGLMLVSGTQVTADGAALPVATGDLVISPNLPRRDIDARLEALAAKVQNDGAAVGIALVDRPLLRHLEAWLGGLAGQSIALVPASATATPEPATGIARK